MVVVKPSQWINFGWIIIGIIGIPWVFPPLVAAYKVAELYFWSYNIDKDYIIEKKGVFSVEHREMSISRIKSIRFEEPFLMRLVGIGNLYIMSSEPYQPELKLWGIHKGSELWNELRKKTAHLRKVNGMRELDVFRL